MPNYRAGEATFGGALAGRSFQISLEWNRAPGQFQQASAPFTLALAMKGKLFTPQVQEADCSASSAVRFAVAGDDPLQPGNGDAIARSPLTTIWRRAASAVSRCTCG